MHRSYLAFATCFVVAMLWSAAVYAEPSVYPTGVTRYDPSKAYNVFVLFSGADQKTHLIDMEGNEVHRWDHSGFPSGLLDPAVISGRTGHVIVWLSIMSGTQTGGDPRFAGGLQEQSDR